MRLFPSTRSVGSYEFGLRVPRSWRHGGPGCWAETVIGPAPDPAAHVLRVDRVLTKTIPLEHLMGIVSFKSRCAMPRYEPTDGHTVHVRGSWRATKRGVTTEEAGAEYRMLEIFCEAVGGNMWYFRISAAIDRLNLELAHSIADSFSIHPPPRGHADEILR